MITRKIYMITRKMCTVWTARLASLSLPIIQVPYILLVNQSFGPDIYLGGGMYLVLHVCEPGIMWISSRN